MATQVLSTSATPVADPFPINGTDYVEFYVGNAKQAAFFYANCFGFQIDQVADLTTGSRDAAHYLITQGNIRMILTTGLTVEHPSNLECGPVENRDSSDRVHRFLQDHCPP